jgi:hypothetical protein
MPIKVANDAQIFSRSPAQACPRFKISSSPRPFSPFLVDVSGSIMLNESSMRGNSTRKGYEHVGVAQLPIPAKGVRTWGPNSQYRHRGMIPGGPASPLPVLHIVGGCGS